MPDPKTLERLAKMAVAIESEPGTGEALVGRDPIDLSTYSGDALMGCVKLDDADEMQRCSAVGGGLAVVGGPAFTVEGAVRWPIVRTPTGDRVLAALRALLVDHDTVEHLRALRVLAASDSHRAKIAVAALALHEREQQP